MTLTCCQDHILTDMVCMVYSHIVEMRDRVTDAGQTMTNNKQVKIELLSQWKLEAEFRNICNVAVKTS